MGTTVEIAQLKVLRDSRKTAATGLDLRKRFDLRGSSQFGIESSFVGSAVGI